VTIEYQDLAADGGCRKKRKAASQTIWRQYRMDRGTYTAGTDNSVPLLKVVREIVFTVPDLIACEEI
jgi:hypothetical protein